ncbi:MAG TPA: response regulator [Anaeromyxobacteraceae bacterium]|nr:response regulator [Anaeromyxobacteraceae bacterium]
MRILVADQGGALAPSCLVFLSYWGHEVEVVTDGLAALRKARSWHPDLVVAPVDLERMDGLTLAAALRVAARTAPVEIALAGPASAEGRERALDAGAVAYLETPLAVVALALTVERVAETRRLREAAGSARAATTRRRGVA